MQAAKEISMIETLYSLKVILVLFLAILALNELALGIQTTETANFYSTRAHLVHQNMNLVDHFFNKTVFSSFIFRRKNPFFSVHKIQTTSDQFSLKLNTNLPIFSPFRYLKNMDRNPSQMMVTASVESFKNP